MVDARDVNLTLRCIPIGQGGREEEFKPRTSTGEEVRRTRVIARQHKTLSIARLLVFRNGRLEGGIIGAGPRQMLEPKTTRYL